jgi:hypothetical protein
LSSISAAQFEELTKRNISAHDSPKTRPIIHTITPKKLPHPMEEMRPAARCPEAKTANRCATTTLQFVSDQHWTARRLMN